MTDAVRPRIGEPAPPLVLTDADGERWELGAERGRCVVLIFHRHIH